MIPLSLFTTDENETALWSHSLACSSRSSSLELSAGNRQKCWREILFIFKSHAVVAHVYIAAIAV